MSGWTSSACREFGGPKTWGRVSAPVSRFERLTN